MSIAVTPQGKLIRTQPPEKLVAVEIGQMSDLQPFKQAVPERLREDANEEDDYEDDFDGEVVGTASAAMSKQTTPLSWAERALEVSQIICILVFVGPLLFYLKRGAVPSYHTMTTEHGANSMRVPTRKLAMITVALVIVSYTSSRLFASGSSLIIFQCLWNATQVCHVLLLVCFWTTCSTRSVFALGILSVALLPLSLYVMSPGGHAFAFIAFQFSLVVTVIGKDVEIVIWEGPECPAQLAQCSVQKLCTVEGLSFICNLLCSMYNYHASQVTWPYWAHVFKEISAFSHFDVKSSDIATNMYSLGFHIHIPAFVPAASGDNVGTLVFVMIWSFLPLLYTVYFLTAFMMSNGTSRVTEVLQKGLCVLGMFHFLFLTDGVDYKYGRGIANPRAEWCHWNERWMWRIAVLLPLYQKIAKDYWKRCHSSVRVGTVIHNTVAIWSLVFLAYQVLLHDVPYFSQWVLGRFDGHHRRQSIESLVTGGKYGYSHALGYHGALVLMTLLYGYSMLSTTCNYMALASIPHG